MNGIKSVLLDSSFVIRLMKPDDPFHGNVVDYFRHFAERGMSTIVVSEYAVVDDPDALKGMGVFDIIDFDYADAAMSGAFRSFLKGWESTGEKGARSVVINDIKLLAQASNRKIDACFHARVFCSPANVRLFPRAKKGGPPIEHENDRRFFKGRYQHRPC